MALAGRLMCGPKPALKKAIALERNRCNRRAGYAGLYDSQPRARHRNNSWTQYLDGWRAAGGRYLDRLGYHGAGSGALDPSAGAINLASELQPLARTFGSFLMPSPLSAFI